MSALSMSSRMTLWRSITRKQVNLRRSTCHLCQYFLACFTTCWARFHLCEILELLQELCLYLDTDSVVITREPRQPNPPLGQFLRELKDELSDGGYIVEFVSGGSKNYGYKTKQGKVCCKVRRCSLHSEGHKYL